MKLRKRTSGETKGAIFLVIILVILVGVTAFLSLSLRTDTVDESLQNESVIKVLFVMEDSNQVLFTDVFFYYPVTQHGALINILGNTGAIYESISRVDRIDAIYSELGIEAYHSEVEKLIGMKIPFYMVLHRDSFSELTDMLGGMSVFVPSPVDVKNDEGQRWLLPSGAVTLDGDKINTYLTYLKSDESDSDLQDRRQNVMTAFLTALNRNRAKMLSAKSFPVYAKKIEANLEGKNLLRLLTEISNVDAERIQPQTITGSRRVVDGKVLLFPFYDGQLIKDVAKQTATALVSMDEHSVNRTYVLEIQNGTNVQGLARNTAVLLQGAGYDVLSTLNADRNDYEQTVIINHIGNKEIAENLGNFIRCTNIVEEEVKPESEGAEVSSNVDFTIILGRDFDGRFVK